MRENPLSSGLFLGKATVPRLQWYPCRRNRTRWDRRLLAPPRSSLPSAVPIRATAAAAAELQAVTTGPPDDQQGHAALASALPESAQTRLDAGSDDSGFR